MLKAIIVDDEENARITLFTLLSEYVEDIEVIAQCENVPEAVLAINKHSPDIVFLDIEMPEYNGFELIEFFKEITFELIFVTAFSQYAIKAFEVSAVDYLLKPVEINPLKSAVEKVKLKIKSNASNIRQRVDLMKQSYQGHEIQKIALPMHDGLLFVEVTKIVLFEADRSYTDIYLNDGSKITVSKPMRIFEDLLVDRKHFFRPHRSFLINIHYLKKYSKGESLIKLDNDICVAISRDRKNDFENLLRDLRMSI
jgi:two-component system, LytTR family, response regulator